jgi:hypothetical protein
MIKNTPLLVLLAVAGVVAIGVLVWLTLRNQNPPPGIDDPRKELKEFLPPRAP